MVAREARQGHTMRSDAPPAAVPTRRPVIHRRPTVSATPSPSGLHPMIDLVLNVDRMHRQRQPSPTPHPDRECRAFTLLVADLVGRLLSTSQDVKCPGCFQITTVFSHASTAVQVSPMTSLS